MNFFCQLGLGNRVASIAAALHFFGKVRFHWRINRDLPSPWQDVFPEGIPNVEFVEFNEAHTSSGIMGKMAYDYFDEVDYHSILSWMGHAAHCNSSVAIHGRFHRIPKTGILDIIEAIPSGVDRVFLLCDNYRDLIKYHLEKLGIKVIDARSRQMSHDFDRIPSDTVKFISDWKSLCKASMVITNCPQSSSLYPLIQSGAQIITT